MNKTLKTILLKTVEQQPREWDLRLKTALWADRTSYKVMVNQTPFRLVYGQEAVVPMEFMVPSLRIAAEHDLDDNQILRVKLEKLLSLDEMRQKAVWSQKVVQNRRKSWQDQQIKVTQFNKGDLVLPHQSRLGPKKPNSVMTWAGPYMVDWVYTNGIVKLKDLTGLRLPGYHNISKIKKYEYALQQFEEKQGEETSGHEVDIQQLMVEVDDLKHLF